VNEEKKITQNIQIPINKKVGIFVYKKSSFKINIGGRAGFGFSARPLTVEFLSSSLSIPA